MELQHRFQHPPFIVRMLVTSSMWTLQMCSGQDEAAVADEDFSPGSCDAPTRVLMYVPVPALLPALALTHVAVIHCLSTWSARVDALHSIVLMEDAGCHCVLSAVILLGMEMWGVPSSTMWTTATYLSLYMAWYVCYYVDRFHRSTLSPCALLLSMASFVTISVPLVLVEATGFTKPGDLEFRFRDHYVGMLTAEFSFIVMSHITEMT